MEGTCQRYVIATGTRFIFSYEMFIPTALYVLQVAVRCSEELIHSLLCKTKGLSDFCSGRNQYHGRMIEFLLNDLFELLSFYDHDILRQKYLT